MSAEVKKRGLGRGLDALFGDVKREEEAFEPKIKRASEIIQAEPGEIVKASETIAQQAPGARPGPVRLAVEKLSPGKFQPRRKFDEAAIDQLAESIAVHGVLQPLLVRPLAGDRYEIIAGERRWRAAQKAQAHDVPVVIRGLTDKEALEIGLIENLQREDLTALEEAEGYQRLMDEFGHTQDALSHQLGKSRSHVANTLRLLKLPQGVKNLVQSGALSAGHARALIGAKDPDSLAGVIIKRALSVRQAEKLVQQAAEGKVKAKTKPLFRQKDVDTLALEEKLSGLLGLRVTIDGAASGKISIEYKTLDQLDDVVARLSASPK